MLVLSRKVNETIRIGKDIEVKVVRLGRERVRLAITAPRDTAVLRGEVFTQQRAQQRESDRGL